MHNRRGKGLPTQGSFRKGDYEAVEKEVLTKLKTGQYELKGSRSGAGLKALVRLDSIRGAAYNGKSDPVVSCWVEVSISLKKGVHMYPYLKEV